MTIQASPQPSALAGEGASGAARMAAGGVRVTSARRAWIGLGALSVAAVLVFWLFDALPFQDLPAHAGLIAMRHRFPASPFEQRFYVLAPHLGPYSLFRFLGEGLVRVVGPVATVRALASLPVIATPAALLFARRRLHGDRTVTIGFYGIALSFGLMTLLGFASYLLGLAAMLVGLTLWLELMVAADERQDTLKRELVMAAAAVLMFVAHGHAFVLFLVVAGVAALADGKRHRRLLRVRALVPALSLAAYVAWIERASSTPPGSVAVHGASLEPYFQGPYDKLSLLITPTLMTRSGIDILIGVVVWTVVLACTIATMRRLRTAVTPERAPRPSFTTEALSSKRHTRALLAGATVIGVMFFALPHKIGWFGFVDGRLVPLFLFLCLMAVRRPALPPLLDTVYERAAPVVGCAMAVLALVASYRFQAEARGYHEVLGVVPREARLLNLPLDPNSDVFTAHPFCHYDKLALAERPVVVSDIWFHQGSALYPTKENPALDLPPTYSESDLRVIDWPSYRLDEWDYVLVRTRPDAPAPWTPPRLSLAEHLGGWWLFKTR